MKKQILILLGVLVLTCGCGQTSAPEDNTQTDSAVNESQETETVDTEAEPASADADTDPDNESPSEQAQAEEENTEVENTSDDAADPKAEEDVSADDGEDLTARDLFADFIKGIGDAKAADDMIWAAVMSDQNIKSGDCFTVSQLTEKVGENEMLKGTDPKVSYAPLECHGKPLYALKYYYETNKEALTQIYIFSDQNKELKLQFVIDGWSRRGVLVNDAGIVSESGSNGAGSHSYTVYAPDQELTYRKVSDVTEQYYGYSFYDEQGDPIKGLNDTIQQAGDGDEKAKDVAYYREIIDGKPYYYFLRGTSKLTQKTVDYIDSIASLNNFRFDGKADADEARTAFEQKLEIEEVVGSEQEPYWKTL